MDNPPFADRHAAGEALASRLKALAPADPVVLALPRGGVPVAAPIARALQAPLGLLLVRKIGAPWQRELAVGAVAGDDATELVIDERLCRELGISRAEIDSEAAVQRAEIARQRSLYLGDRASLPLRERSVIVVDDGIATGTTMRAALQSVRTRQPRALLVATPVASHDALAMLRGEVDEVVCLATPSPFRAVGLHYIDFGAVEDRQVLNLLQQHAQRERAPDRP
jgi:putative phosphoribosyl transferase